ncbi:hypothetical protein EIN_379560 [Entamoeba invadens IP1]|uniref:Uncharacterized protein n=1 Tax=Entamoeba invadens IP1 TaxID=370355 RepID=A0A0A1UFZ8_ENTIV|nr:hypothetical protein EIN_379560 [Entamoeba invadens IP1]ELP92079.1 hypothetical protein EIN_379560 [Entamoeba invadens IP1]|eukprot:XP_004258850.1 hypothetical protein EIN_379560 [Entamoeba invadens IP1]
MLRVSKDKVFVIYKNTVQIYSSELEKVGHVVCEGNVSGVVELANKHYVTVGDDKKINVFDEGFRKIREIMLTKKLTSIIADENVFLVSDKFGDVFKFTEEDIPKVEEQKDEKKEKENKECATKNIVITHFSVINEISFTKKKNAIVSCDRDEKVRVTRYPRTDIIQSFCYGFVELVTSAKTEEIDGRGVVVCGGCDGKVLFFWVDNGEEIGRLQFEPSNVVIVYDALVVNKSIQCLVGIEGEALYLVKATYNANSGKLENVEKNDIFGKVKGAQRYKDDTLVYTDKDELVLVQAKKSIPISGEGSSAELKNDGVNFKEQRKVIEPAKRFVGIEEDDGKREKKSE